MKKIFILSLILAVGGAACTPKKQSANTIAENKIEAPQFNADSAYTYIEKQVDFGPRVPNTNAQLACADYLTASLKRFNATVTRQESSVTAYNGTKLRNINIIGAFNPDAQARILLFSHWDSRPWADQDPDPANRNTPVMAANDGASGVGVLLEIARQLAQKQPTIGVDIIFFDTEDYGVESDQSPNAENSWCLGTQYWAHSPHIPGYRARFGILLDMVGAGDATFYREQYSDYYASFVVNNVWNTAAKLGFGKYFINEKGGAITDDHVYINQIAEIPSIDIIQYNPHFEKGFANYWHTIHDTMDNIDKNTLHAVGTTLLHVIYNEQ
ncbi:MAG: M28 family peptidase [Paludibacter sp.]|nr:M28 family peptidase [Paludibacter sp.]